MSILKKLHSSVLVFVVFLLTGARPAVGRALPSAQEGQKPDANVSTSVEPRAADQGGDTKGGDDKGSKSGDDKGSKSGDDKSSKGGDGGNDGQGGGDGDFAGGGG